MVLELTEAPSLVIWAPDGWDPTGRAAHFTPYHDYRDGLINHLDPDDYAFVEGGGSYLVYTLSLTPSVEQPRYHATGYRGFVDARTGRILKVTYSVYDPEVQPYLGAGSGVPMALARWSWPSTPVTAWVGKGTKVTGSAKPASEASKPIGEPATLVVQAGKCFTQAHYDAAKNLLWVEAGGKRTYAKPDANLRKALAKALR